MRMAPEEANGALTPYAYEEGELHENYDADPEALDETGLGFFSREGLYLDDLNEVIIVGSLVFVRPEYRSPEEVSAAV